MKHELCAEWNISCDSMRMPYSHGRARVAHKLALICLLHGTAGELVTLALPGMTLLRCLSTTVIYSCTADGSTTGTIIDDTNT